MVPVLREPVKLNTGVVLSSTAVTTLLFIKVEQPLLVLVITALYVPAALNDGLAVFSVPATIPFTGCQLYDTFPVFVIIVTEGFGLAQVMETDDTDKVVVGMPLSATTSIVLSVTDEDTQPLTVLVTTTVKIPHPLAIGLDVV